MKIIKPGFEFITPIDGSVILKRLEECGRVCYKSEGKITDDSAPKFVAGIIKRGHEAVLEHCSFTVKFICDRGVSHEIVRHRLASYCQESTRYCNYGRDQFGSEITVIEPCYLNENTFAYDEWKEACRRAETAYFNLLNWGLSPQEAPRSAPEQPQNGGRYDSQYPRVASLLAAPYLHRRASADTGDSYTTAA